MTQSTSLTLLFTEEPQAETDGFNPTVYPEAYDPSRESNVPNAISDCDQWILQPWYGFEFHVPAISYRYIIYQEAKASLPAKYEQAKNAYNQQLLEYIANQRIKGMTNITHTYDSPTMSIQLTTGGVMSSTTAYASNPNPNTSLSLFFSPENKEDSGMSSGGGEGCKMIPWEVFYEGKAQWNWNAPEVYNSWENSAQGNWKVGGASAGSYAPVPNIKMKLKVGTSDEWLPFYVYYDPAYNTPQTALPYNLKPLPTSWQTVATPMQTLEVQKLFTSWYVPYPINPIPVDPSRVNKAPYTFAGNMLTSEYIMRLAIGYVPPSGIKDAKYSDQRGTNVNLTRHLRYTVDLVPYNSKNGYMTVPPFNFAELLDAPFKKSVIPENLWSQHGLHNLELICLNSQGYFRAYDDRSRARKEMLRKTYSKTWYIPSLDKGEYLYKKRWTVLNIADSLYHESPQMMLKVLYAKRYGNIGLKRVLEITNPFDRDIFFATNTANITAVAIEYLNGATDFTYAIRIKKDSTIKVTVYSHHEMMSNMVIFFSTPDVEALIATKVFYVENETTYYVYSASVSDQLIASSNQFCKMPQGFYIYSRDAIQPDVPIIVRTPLNYRFPVWCDSSYYWAPSTGQKCTCTITSYNSNEVQPTAVQGFFSRLALVMNTRSRANVVKKPRGSGDYISKDIPHIYQTPFDVQRQSVWDGYMYLKGLLLPLGGAVDQLCDATDALDTYPVTMATPASIGVPGVFPSPQLTYLDPNTPTGFRTPGWFNKVGRTWIITDIVLDPTDVPVLHCVMRGRLVEGWDDKPIEILR